MKPDQGGVDGKWAGVPIDIGVPVGEICEALELDPNYVANMTITPTSVDVTLFLGKEGRFKGPKFFDHEAGRAAVRLETYRVSTVRP